MSKPKQIPIGKELKEDILFRAISHSEAINRVLMNNNSDNGIALLGGINLGSTEGAPMFASAAWCLIASGGATAQVTVSLS
jgi:hypothetical protein